MHFANVLKGVIIVIMSNMLPTGEYAPTVQVPEGDSEKLERFLIGHRKLRNDALFRLHSQFIPANDDDAERAAQASANLDYLLEHWPDGKPRDLGISLEKFREETQAELDAIVTTDDETAERQQI